MSFQSIQSFVRVGGVSLSQELLGLTMVIRA